MFYSSKGCLIQENVKISLSKGVSVLARNTFTKWKIILDKRDPCLSLQEDYTTLYYHECSSIDGKASKSTWMITKVFELGLGKEVAWVTEIIWLDFILFKNSPRTGLGQQGGLWPVPSPLPRGSHCYQIQIHLCVFMYMCIQEFGVYRYGCVLLYTIGITYP